MDIDLEFQRTLREAGAGPGAARAVRALSDFFLRHPGAPTPWDQSFAEPGYLTYFLPLNYVRVRTALRELERFVPPEQIAAVVDFGSGSGAVHFALEAQSWLSPRPFYCVERSARAALIHRKLADLRAGAWAPRFEKPRSITAGTLGIFSYSFLEIEPDLKTLNDFDHLLIVEPSTRACGRALMKWRERLLEAGYRALAPCTHDSACPLLVNSPRDWCHHRVEFDPPAWWTEIEAELPMKNQTLTHSYLLVSRKISSPAHRGRARVIGDTLYERGKTRQMICRGPKREFLSWLHRAGEPERIPRGALVGGIETTEAKGDERRVTADATLDIQT